ncbi:MAG: SDR family oxidoreductase [Bacillota bacterium]|jgi:NAD(P)-dependent dehydrogenase (short-subunit alcohol dehydrogenase family)|nr:SDR family oxidoreductase [Bacillota bacterium]HHU43313.1 SDR family oxidoreductase [Clostridiales bacterium]
MTKKFSNKTIIITGAAKGQGRATAIAFAKNGANIVAFDLPNRLCYPAYNDACQNDLISLKKEINSFGGKVEICFGDVRNEKDVIQTVNVAAEKFKTIDILFNNAGICAYGMAHELTEEEWDFMMDINCKGAFLFSKHVIPHMRRQKSGVIVNNSSIAGLRGMKRLSHYAASKWAMVGLTKSLALELAEYNVRVVSLHATGVNTPMNDGLAFLEGETPEAIAQKSAGNLLNTPWIEVEDVVNAMLYICSDKARFMTGSQFVLDAGLLTR